MAERCFQASETSYGIDFREATITLSFSHFRKFTLSLLQHTVKIQNKGPRNEEQNPLFDPKSDDKKAKNEAKNEVHSQK